RVISASPEVVAVSSNLTVPQDTSRNKYSGHRGAAGSAGPRPAVRGGGGVRACLLPGAARRPPRPGCRPAGEPTHVDERVQHPDALVRSARPTTADERPCRRQHAVPQWHDPYHEPPGIAR